MSVSSDWIELLAALNAAKARYLVVGAHAVARYAEPRYTKDLDLWVEASGANAERVWAALVAFGAPLQGVTVEDFARPELVYQMGVEPNRVDILMGIDGVTFEKAWANRERAKLGDVTVYFLGRKELLAAKRAAGRLQDQLDIELLRAAERKQRAKRKKR